MFNIGDLVIYSAHGICKIGDICDKTVAGITRKYYVLQPIENDHQLTISTPVENDKVDIFELIGKEEAIEILQSFKKPGIEWEENHNSRSKLYSSIVHSGERKNIAKVVNTLLRKKVEIEQNDKKFYVQDHDLLVSTQSTLFKEMSIALDSSVEAIDEIVMKNMAEAKEDLFIN